MPRKTTRNSEPKTDPAPPKVETPPQAEDKPSKVDTPPAETAPAADEPAEPDPLTAGQALDPATLGLTSVAPEEPPQAAQTREAGPEVSAPPVKAPVPAPAPPAEAASVADDHAKPGPEGAQTREAGPDEPAHLLIVVRRPHRFGGEERPVGWPLAEVRLAPGVDINTVVDAVRNGFATDKPAD